MAIVLCKECTREISSEAVFCPHCGYPLKNSNAQANPSQSDDSFSAFDDLASNPPR